MYKSFSSGTLAKELSELLESFETARHRQSLMSIMNHAHLRIQNTFEDLDSFYKLLYQLDITNIERLRPSWDTYFMKLCDLAASRSNCMLFMHLINLFRHEKTCWMHYCQRKANYRYRL